MVGVDRVGTEYAWDVLAKGVGILGDAAGALHLSFVLISSGELGASRGGQGSWNSQVVMVIWPTGGVLGSVARWTLSPWNHRREGAVNLML